MTPWVSLLLVAALLTVPAPADATFVGTPGEIAYVSNGHAPGGDVDSIYTTQPDGSGTRLLLTAGGAAAHPSWSADGSQLAYEADGGIWVAGADGSGARRLADGGHPSWSPDGAQLAFQRRDGEFDAIFTIAVDGGDPVQVSPRGTVAPTAADPDGGDIANYLEPAWSPDGTRIAVARQLCTYNYAQGFGCYYRPQLALLDVATGGVTILHEVVQGEEEGGADADHIGAPDWAPDGSRIAFQRRVAEQQSGVYFRTFDIFTIPVGGGTPTNVTQTAELEAETQPSWSPDGSAIAYTHLFGGSSNDEEIYVIPAGGGTPRNVTNAPGPSYAEYVADRDPAWRPLGGGGSSEPAPAPSPPPPAAPPPPPPSGAPAPPAAFDQDPATTERVMTADPTAAAIAIAQGRFPGGGGSSTTAAHHVVLSRVDAFPDSLTGSALTRSGPLLFTDSSTLTAAARAEIDRLLQPPAVVYLLGGTNAISPAIEAELAAAGYTPRRLAGPSRVETALAVADEVLRISPEPVDRVLLARSGGVPGNETSGWADSVSAGGLAAAADMPILLTASGSLHPAVAEWLADNGITDTVLLGGSAALSTAVESAVPGPFRVAGAERTATAAAIATQLWQVGPADADRAFVIINGTHPSGWAFGLAAAGVAADTRAPVLLVGGAVSDATAEMVSACGAPQVEMMIVGDTTVVSEDVQAQLEALDRDACSPGEARRR